MGTPESLVEVNCGEGAFKALREADNQLNDIRQRLDKLEQRQKREYPDTVAVPVEAVRAWMHYIRELKNRMVRDPGVACALADQVHGEMHNLLIPVGGD